PPSSGSMSGPRDRQVSANFDRRPAMTDVKTAVRNVLTAAVAAPPKRSEAFVFTFPFWIYIDTISPPKIIETEVRGRRLSFYPPFSSGSATFIPPPYVNVPATPSKPQATVRFPPGHRLVEMASIPVLATEANPQFSIFNVWSPNWETGFPSAQLPTDSVRID